MENCIFCQIIDKKIPAKIEYEDSKSQAFHDIHPKTKTHLLIIPKKHIATLSEAETSDQEILGHLLKTAADLAKQFNLENYRIGINNGKGAGQEVFHLHVHLMSAPQ